MTFEEDASQGKDRPVLVVGRDDDRLLGLMLSSQAHRADDANWTAIGSGPWDGGHKASYVRLDRVLDVPEQGIRREVRSSTAPASTPSRSDCAASTAGPEPLARQAKRVISTTTSRSVAPPPV